MSKFDVGTRVYTICKLDPKRIGVVESITPTGRINVSFPNRLGGSFTVQFTKNGTYGKGYFQTTLDIVTPEVEEEVRRQDLIDEARRTILSMKDDLSYDDAVQIMEIFGNRGGQP